MVLGGADFYAHYAYRSLYEFPTPILPMFGLHHEMWALNTQFMPIEYSSIVTALAWVPHQAIATFLVASFLIGQTQRRFPVFLLCFGLLSLWSPYGMIGLLPLVLVEAWRHREQLLARESLLAGIGGAVFAILVVFYLSVELPSKGACLQCFPERLTRLHQFAPFLFFELLPFGLMLGRRLWSNVACRTSLITLTPLPLLYGESGDLVMRASLGPLFVLALASIDAVLSDWSHVRRRVVQVTALLLCVPTAISEIVYLRTAGEAHRAFASWDPLVQEWVVDFARGDRLTAQQFFDRCGWKYLPQYFATRESFVLRPASVNQFTRRDLAAVPSVGNRRLMTTTALVADTAEVAGLAGVSKVAHASFAGSSIEAAGAPVGSRRIPAAGRCDGVCRQDCLECE
jgi:hypothetical protein